ncbi:methyl-accepting chemotaxis protein I [Vibrio variabilis]|uniref:Methyl-accepting chemotaxis protein I n=1 Tax=Vibrio variabilis TaxID=990271 RepID=A0ABQ0JAU3_9VIBR|nr:methyl-accepting chemotaxis protein I [Vibrio variabilis]
MQGSVIRRMYAGFTLIVVLFVITIGIMLNGMSQIHDNFGSVSNTSLPLVSMSNQTSVELLSADKSFKDFLTTQNEERMALRREEFSASMQSFGSALEELAQVSQGFPELEAAITELRDVQTRYDQEAQVAMDNYQSMFAAQEQVQQSTRRFQKLNTDLSVGMKEYVDDASSISVKVMAKSYFIKLKDAELITSDALASSDTTFVQDAVNKNRKAVTHLNYAFNGLATQMPALKKAFEASVQQFSKDVAKKAACLTNTITI